MKAIAATDALLRFSDHNKPFVIETDASDYQLGTVIKQDGKPVACHLRKLNAAQNNYAAIEKDSLSVVKTFEAHRFVLCGARLNTHTDHRDLTHKMTQFQTQRVVRWRPLLEECEAQCFHKKGEDDTT